MKYYSTDIFEDNTDRSFELDYIGILSIEDLERLVCLSVGLQSMDEIIQEYNLKKDCNILYPGGKSIPLFLYLLMIELYVRYHENVDWELVTSGYQRDKIYNIFNFYSRPFTSFIDDNQNEYSKDAREKIRIDTIFSKERMQFLCNPFKGVKLDIENNLATYFYDKQPKNNSQLQEVLNPMFPNVESDFLRWELITKDFIQDILHPFSKDYIPFDIQATQRNIKRLKDKRGEKAAAWLIRQLQKEFPKIKDRQLFRINQMTPEAIAAYEKFVFSFTNEDLLEWEGLPNKATKSKTVTPKKSKHFLETVTFIYRYLNTTDGNRRLSLLYQFLSKEYRETKSYIASETTPDEFYSLFSGESNNNVVTWTGSKQDLYYFIKRMVERNIIDIPQGSTIWTITQNHFSDRRGNLFLDLRNQHKPQISADVIDRLINILDPAATTSTDLTELSKKLSTTFGGK